MRHRYQIFCVSALAIIMCGASPDPSADDHARNSVEQRQKIELENFYYGDARNNKVPMTPMAIQLYNDGVKFYEKGEYDLARQAVLDSLEIEKRNPLAYELLGTIADLKQDFEQAEKYYKQSYLLNPSPRLRERIGQLQKEHGVEKNLNTYDEEHFIIKYREGEEGYEGYWLKNMLRDSYRQVSQDFGYYLNHKIAVLFYNRNEFHSLTGQEHWVGGLYDGKIRLPAFRQGFREADLKAAAVHEMTHAFVGILSGMKAPIWLHEGLAEYEENKIHPINLLVLKAGIKSKTLIPMAQLLSEKDPGKKKSSLEIMLFYQESYSFVNYLIQKYQMYRIKEILAKFKDGKNAEEALEDVLGASVTQLETAWRATL